MKLTPQNVEDLFKSLLYSAGEPTGDAVIVEGIMRKFGLHPGRLEAAKPQVALLLNELSDQFKETVGGGWSFLQACYDKEGNLWTGDHSIMELLFVMGMGAGLVECLVARERWGLLPGGMPYYVVKASPQLVVETQH